MDNNRDISRGQSSEEHPLKKPKKQLPRPPHLDTDEKLHAFMQAVHKTWCRKLKEGYVIPECLNTKEKCKAYLKQHHQNYMEKVKRVRHSIWWKNIVNKYQPVTTATSMTTSASNETSKHPKRTYNDHTEVMPYVNTVMNNSSSEKLDEVMEENNNQQKGFVSIEMVHEEKSLNDSTDGDDQGEEESVTIIESDNFGSAEWNDIYDVKELNSIENIDKQQNSFLEHLLGQEGCSYALDHCGGCLECDKIWVQPMIALGLPLNAKDLETWQHFFGSASHPGDILS
jgi:hypothetical protein